MPRPTTLPAPWDALAERLGGVGKLAEALGATPRSINRWARSEMAMNGAAKKLFLTLCQKYKLTP